MIAFPPCVVISLKMMSLSVTTHTSSNNPVALVFSYVCRMTVLSPSSCISFAGNRVAAYRAGIIAILIIIRFFAGVKLQYLGKHLIENKFHLLYLKGLELS